LVDFVGHYVNDLNASEFFNLRESAVDYAQHLQIPLVHWWNCALMLICPSE